MRTFYTLCLLACACPACAPILGIEQAEERAAPVAAAGGAPGSSGASGSGPEAGGAGGGAGTGLSGGGGFDPAPEASPEADEPPDDAAPPDAHPASDAHEASEPAPDAATETGPDATCAPLQCGSLGWACGEGFEPCGTYVQCGDCYGNPNCCYAHSCYC